MCELPTSSTVMQAPCRVTFSSLLLTVILFECCCSMGITLESMSLWLQRGRMSGEEDDDSGGGGDDDDDDDDDEESRRVVHLRSI